MKRHMSPIANNARTRLPPSVPSPARQIVPMKWFVIEFAFGQQSQAQQFFRKLFRDAVAHGFQVVRLNAPLPQLLQSFESFLLFRAAVPEREQREFLNDGGRHRKRIALSPKNLDEIVCEILCGSEGR